MFVRIVKGSHDSIYQCDRVHIQVINADELLMELVTNQSADHGRCVTVAVDKTTPDALGVYCMNDEGQTIDTIFRKEAG